MNESKIPKKHHAKIKSVEVGFAILRTAAERKVPVSLSQLAESTGLFKSQLYRYLNTFVELGVLIRHDDGSPRWTLGPELILLGSAAFEEMDLSKQAATQLIELRNRINETVSLSIWRDRGPFFLRWEKSNKTFNVGVDTGSYVPLYTATGKIFRAFLPKDVTDLLYREIVERGEVDPAAYDADIANIQKSHLAVSLSRMHTGAAAMSTPIFDVTGQLSGALSVIGLQNVLDTTLDGPVGTALRKTAEEISYRMGFRPVEEGRVHLPPLEREKKGVVSGG